MHHFKAYFKIHSRKLKLWRGLSSRQTQRNSTPLPLLRNLDLVAPNVTAETFTGDTLKKEKHVEIHCKYKLATKTSFFFRCEGKYTFIGNGTGGENKITFAEAWQGKTIYFKLTHEILYLGFEKSLTGDGCNSIKRYPVVARWRNDVDYVAAGIYCFQPYCVTGELDPPANPLICPQFCARFNDLDNIGLTGRHYSGFIMMGIQVFNYPEKYHFFKDECIEFNYRWLT